MGVGLELEGPFQLFSSMALILVVEFQTQEWGWSGPYSSNQERLSRRGGLRESGPLPGDGPLKAEGGMRSGDPTEDRFVTSDSREAVKVQLPVKPSHVPLCRFTCKSTCVHNLRFPPRSNSQSAPEPLP